MTDYSVTPGLRQYVASEIIPRYLAFDKAHNIEHVQAVIDRSLRLASFFRVRTDMVYTAAAYHDTGLCCRRELHHIHSARILSSDERLQEWFTAAQIRTMARAAEDHRASSERAPRSIYGRIVAEADRIIDPDTVLRRTVQFGLEHHPEEGEAWQYARFCEHLCRKYGPGGYMRLWIPQSDNAEQLCRLREMIADRERLRAAFDAIYLEESGRATRPDVLPPRG